MRRTLASRTPLLANARAQGRHQSVLARLLTLALFWSSLFSVRGDGQSLDTASIRGRVLADDSTPVIAALVELASQAKSVRTSSSGEFVFQRIPVGTAILRIRAFGFADKEQQVQIARDSGWRGNIVLTRIPQSLPEVVVSATGAPNSKYADFFRRRQLGVGTFRTRGEIDSMGAFDIVAVLKSIPGVSVSATHTVYGQPETRFRLARCPGQPPNLAIYINGQRVALFGGDTQNKGSELSSLFQQHPPSSTCEDCARIGEVLSSIPISEIEFIEFYRGPGQIPADLDRGDSCAALVVWTR